jgi:CopG family nickel-responsive transcriptional regulator
VLWSIVSTGTWPGAIIAIALRRSAISFVRALIDSEIHTNKVVVGVIHLLYDHHRRELAEQLTEIQHAKHELIISTTHVHLDHQHCLEVILCRGKAAQISQLADALIAVKGVSNGHLYLTTAV